MTKIASENRWFRFYDFEISGHEQETENGSGTILQLPAAYVGIDVSSNGLSLQKIHQLNISNLDLAYNSKLSYEMLKALDHACGCSDSYCLKVTDEPFLRIPGTNKMRSL